MGWCSATEIMDAAVEAADRAVAAAWQTASGSDGARTPAFANALQADPSLREKLDEVMRPFVAAIAAKLRAGDWDCIEEADAFDRFRAEMLGYNHEQMTDYYRERLYEADDPDSITRWAQALQQHADKTPEEASRGIR
jgi:erythromycin esterase-like protein